MSNNIHPNLQAALDNMSDEQIAKILNTKYSASDIKSQMERLEEIKAKLCKPGQVTIVGYVARDNCGPQDLGLRIYTAYPKRMEGLKRWNGREAKSVLIDHRLFPEVTWESEPKRVKITITPID